MSEKSKSDISQYFANDPPSLFDQIGQKLGEAALPDPMSLLAEEEAAKPPVSKDVIDLWESPKTTDSSIPPPLTLPGCLAVEFGDYIKEVSAALLGGANETFERSKLLTDKDVTQDDRGLRQLIHNGCYRAALSMTSRLLAVYNQGANAAGQPSKNTPHSLQLWFTRLALLLRLGQYEVCQREAEAFGDLDRVDVFYEHQPEMYPGRKGSMACFSFRLLLAELPIYAGLLSMALDKLTDLLDVCRRIRLHFEEHPEKETKVEAKRFWASREDRVLCSIVNCALLMKNFNLAADILKQLSEREGITNIHKSAILGALGRVYLQCGDIVSAEKNFGKARELKGAAPDVAECVNRGLMACAQNDFQEGYQSFQKGLAVEPENMMLYNNMAVCLLYSGKLKEAIATFERAVDLCPQRALNENLLLNLATLYELESNNAKTKKLSLLRKVCTHKPDLNCRIDVCLKLDYKRSDEARENYV